MQPQQQCWDYSFDTSSGWPKFAYVPNHPETRRVTYKLHFQGRQCWCFFFLYFRYSFVLNFEVGHFACHFLFLSFFLPFDVAVKGIQSTQLCCHISFLSFGLPPVFNTAGGGCWIQVYVGSSACIYCSPHVVSLNDEPRFAHRRHQSAGSAFQFHYTHLTTTDMKHKYNALK